MTTTAIIATCRDSDHARAFTTDVADLYAQLDADEGFGVDFDDDDE